MSTGPITDAEAQIYDRQIRLWGMDAQLQLRKSRILVVGLDALSTEVCKNICLAGVSSIYLWDYRDVDAQTISSTFLPLGSSSQKNVCFIIVTSFKGTS